MFAVTQNVRHQSRGVINVLDNVDLVHSNVQFSHQEAFLYVFEDRSSDQDDYQRKESHKVTYFQDPQSCA